MVEKLTVEELITMIQEGLNTLDGVKHEYFLHTQVGRTDDLPKELKGYAKQDNAVIGVGRTVGNSSYSKLPNQELYNVNLRVEFFIRNSQYKEVNEEIIKYVTSKNGIAITIGDFHYIPQFDLGKPGASIPMQGVDRTPLYFNVNFTVAQKGLLSEDIEVYLDGRRVNVLNYTATNTASLSKKLRTDYESSDNYPNILKSRWTGSTLSVNMSFLYVKTAENQEIINELYATSGNKPIHTFRYVDWGTDTTFNVYFENIQKSFSAGNFALLEVLLAPVAEDELGE